MSKRKNRVPAAIDPEFKERLGRIKRKVSEIQNIDISFTELTRRMSKAFSMQVMEKELLEDAKAKRKLGIDE